jgi:diguanylate cyclase (GGDEF)-like protein
MTGYMEEELIGQSPRILQGLDTDRKVIDQLSRKIRAGEFFEGSPEEFLILLPNTPLDDAVSLAERVRNLVATTPQVASDPVTISFGVGQWRPGESVAAFVEHIDAATYAAKSGGRNRVVSSL